MKVAEDPSTKGDRVLMARSFHTATVYLEVLSSFNALGPGVSTVVLRHHGVLTVRRAQGQGSRSEPMSYQRKAPIWLSVARLLAAMRLFRGFLDDCPHTSLSTLVAIMVVSWSASCNAFAGVEESRRCRWGAALARLIDPLPLSLPPVAVPFEEHERQLQYTKWRTYQCSHLLENIKHEFLDTEGRVDDHYFLEKARGFCCVLPSCETDKHNSSRIEWHNSSTAVARSEDGCVVGGPPHPHYLEIEHRGRWHAQ